MCIGAACPIPCSWCAPEVSDQRAEQFLADSVLAHRVATACVDQLEGVTKSPERRACQRLCVKPGAPKHRPVKNKVFAGRQLFQPVERKRCRRIDRASRVERVMLITRMKDTDSAGGGLLEPVTSAATHPQADAHSDLIAREGTPQRYLAVDQAAAVKDIIASRERQIARKRASRNLRRLEPSAVDRIAQVFDTGNRDTSPGCVHVADALSLTPGRQDLRPVRQPRMMSSLPRITRCSHENIAAVGVPMQLRRPASRRRCI